MSGTKPIKMWIQGKTFPIQKFSEMTKKLNKPKTDLENDGPQIIPHEEYMKLLDITEDKGINSFIIPDELPSILSVIYSNIPTLKKGTDSRIGWGFRLGDRADFQILTELGPQQYTQKLANQQDENEANKRSTLENLANTLYAQRQQDKKQQHAKKQQQDKKQHHQKENETDLKSGNDQWLQNWSKTMKKTEEFKPIPTTQNVPSNAKPGLGIGEIDAKSVIPDDTILEQLENQKQKSTTTRKPLKTSKPGKPAPANQTLLEILTQDDRLTILADEKDQSPLDDISLE